MSLTDEGVERFVEAEAHKKTQRNAQRRSIDEVVFCQIKTKHDNSQDIPPPELDAYLSIFLLSVRKVW